jgi:hypothetical protein
MSVLCLKHDGQPYFCELLSFRQRLVNLLREVLVRFQERLS